MKLKVTSHSEDDTIAFAEKIAKVLEKGTIIALQGDLGAGKTHFVKGLALGLGASEIVTSPTFTLLNIYESGKMPLYHFDMYRLSSAEEAQELGFDEYLDSKTLDGITVVEWPECVEGLIKGTHIVVKIEKLEKGRNILIWREE